tara:strand:+ start:123 stop:458 length:336 start_codon:yes stop_codon:yes gene_type:complete
MTEREISLEAINSLYRELMLGLKRICVTEFGKPSDVIDRNGNPITEKRFWAQEELKILYNIYNPQQCIRGKERFTGPTDLSLLNDDELNIIYQSLLTFKITFNIENKIWEA